MVFGFCLLKVTFLTLDIFYSLHLLPPSNFHSSLSHFGSWGSFYLSGLFLKDSQAPSHFLLFLCHHFLLSHNDCWQTWVPPRRLIIHAPSCFTCINTLWKRSCKVTHVARSFFICQGRPMFGLDFWRSHFRPLINLQPSLTCKWLY